MSIHHRHDYTDIDEEEEKVEDYNNIYDESSLGGDSYEGPYEDDPACDEEDDDEGDDEFNQHVGWDGRRKDDLY
jgi:hypothetical protein